MLTEKPPLRLSEDVFDYDSDDEPNPVPYGDLDDPDGEFEVMDITEPDLLNLPIREAARQASNFRNQGRGLLPKVQAVCKLLTSLDFNIGDFLYALSWGDPECTADDIVRYHRTALFQNDLLLHILRN